MQESDRCSQESADSTAGLRSLASGRSSGRRRVTSGVEASSSVTGQASVASTTCAPSPTTPPATSSAAASPARMSRLQVRAPASTATAAASGTSSLASFAFYDHVSFSWRTSQGCLIGSDTFSGRWPRSGTMRSGACSRRPRSARRTAESASSCLPTPTAKTNFRGRGSKGGIKLGNLARDGALLPTPTVSGNHNRKGLSQKSGDGLATAVGGLLCPRFVEAMMGFPVAWTARDASERSATPSSPSKPRLRGTNSRAGQQDGADSNDA